MGFGPHVMRALLWTSACTQNCGKSGERRRHSCEGSPKLQLSAAEGVCPLELERRSFTFWLWDFFHSTEVSVKVSLGPTLVLNGDDDIFLEGQKDN